MWKAARQSGLDPRGAFHGTGLLPTGLSGHPLWPSLASAARPHPLVPSKVVRSGPGELGKGPPTHTCFPPFFSAWTSMS